jgi:predicted Fe-S protein YdhL (DUF1289 family)
MSDKAIASPCIRKCCLDTNNICLGCFRSLTEIMQWTEVNEPTRQCFLDNAKRRKQHYLESAHHQRIFP